MFHVKHLRKALIHKDLCVKQNKPTADILDSIGGGSSMVFIRSNTSEGGPIPSYFTICSTWNVLHKLL